MSQTRLALFLAHSCHPALPWSGDPASRGWGQLRPRASQLLLCSPKERRASLHPIRIEELVDKLCFLQKSLSWKVVYQGLAVCLPLQELLLGTLANQVFNISANQKNLLLSHSPT